MVIFGDVNKLIFNMKKLLFCMAATLLLVSCSSSEEPIIEKGKLVPAVIKISSENENTTRAYLGFPNSSSITTVPVVFEAGDEVYVNDGSENLFTIDKDGSNTTMSGEWLEDMDTPCYAMFGKTQGGHKMYITAKGPSQYIDEDGKIQYDESKLNVELEMFFELPDDQATVHLTRDNQNGVDAGVTCQKNALLAFALPVFKGVEMKFIPVVSYLYFESAEPTCKIVSNMPIAGRYSVGYAGMISTNMSGYATAAQLWEKNLLSFTEQLDKKEIECRGQKVNENDALYKYVVAIKPDKKYSANDGINILIGKGNGNGYESGPGFHNKVDVELAPNVVYYLGCVDPVPASAPARGVEQTTLPFGR